MQLFVPACYTTIDGVSSKLCTTAVAFVRRADDKLAAVPDAAADVPEHPSPGQAPRQNKCPRTAPQDTQQKQKP